MTADEIIAAAVKTRNALGALDQEAGFRINELNDQEALTDADRAERDRLEATQDKIARALLKLDFDTLHQLDQSETVKRLLGDMKTVNQRLSKDLDRLKAAERFAQTAAQVAKFLADLVAGLGKLAATFG